MNPSTAGRTSWRAIQSYGGAMLRSVLELGDTQLSLGVNGVTDWLEAAEHP